MPGHLFDATTLQNFAVVGRLDLLENLYGYRPPHWTQVIQSELTDGLNLAGLRHLHDVLTATWLGAPLEPTTKQDRKEIEALHVGLNDGRRPPIEHAGEAESIYFCQELDAAFVTDDRGAGAFAKMRGVQVIDTIDILQTLQTDGTLTCDQAWDLLESMMNADRVIRRNRMTKAELCV